MQNYHRLRVFENRVLRKIFGPKRVEVIGGPKNCIRCSFMYCNLLQYNLYDQVKKDEKGRTYNTNGGKEDCLKEIGGKARRKETTRKTKL
jgi:hypothetical protein